jgi:hypothetical protein
LVKTKGDNNRVSYEVLDYPIREANYYGKVIYVIPMVGLISIPPFTYVIAAIGISLILATFSIGILLYKKKINKEGEKNNNNKK